LFFFTHTTVTINSSTFAEPHFVGPQLKHWQQVQLQPHNTALSRHHLLQCRQHNAKNTAQGLAHKPCHAHLNHPHLTLHQCCTLSQQNKAALAERRPHTQSLLVLSHGPDGLCRGMHDSLNVCIGRAFEGLVCAALTEYRQPCATPQHLGTTDTPPSSEHSRGGCVVRHQYSQLA